MKKGQVEAPIELVVAVIVLAMSLALAFYVMGRTDESKCISMLKTETEKLQSAMLDVALGSPPTSRTVYFKMPKCGSIDVQVLQFVYYNDPTYCKLCPSHYGGCWQIIPASVSKQGDDNVLVPVTDAISCINMAGEIEITEAGCSDAGRLTNDPCPSASEIQPCNPRLSSTLRESASWASFYGGRGGFRNYEINLTKQTAVTGSPSRQVGQIRVCIAPVGQATATARGRTA